MLCWGKTGSSSDWSWWIDSLSNCSPGSLSDCCSGSLSNESIWALLLGCVGFALAFDAFDFDFPKRNYIYVQNKYNEKTYVCVGKFRPRW